MECHSTPDVAPAAMVRKYGSANGFGWNLDPIIAAQIVSVPISVADEAFHRLLIFLIATFLVTILALDAGRVPLVGHLGIRNYFKNRASEYKRSGRASTGASLAPLINQIGHQPSPSGLVAGPQSGAVIAVEVLMK